MPKILNIYSGNGFALGIYGGLRRDRNRIELSHGQVYSIQLENHRSTPAEVELKIDGKSVGFFLLDPYQKIEVEHPVGLNRKFTFFQLDQLTQSKKIRPIQRSTNGLVEAIFNPGQLGNQKKINFKSFKNQGMIPKGYYDQSEGMTTFTVPSQQKFDTYQRYYFDESDFYKTKIEVRLVGKPRYNLFDQWQCNYSTPSYQWTSNPTPLELPFSIPIPINNHQNHQNHQDHQNHQNHYHSCHHCCHCQCSC